MDARGISMSRNLTQIGILMIFCCVLCGCSSTVPQRKEVLKEPKIHEEELPDNSVRRPGEDERAPAITGPPAPAAESPTNLETREQISKTIYLERQERVGKSLGYRSSRRSRSVIDEFARTRRKFIIPKE